MTAKNAALELAKGGLPVFPCRPDKRPYTIHGLKEASTNIEQISAWWRRWSGALVGVPTGRVSRLVAVDIDPAGQDKHHRSADSVSPRWLPLGAIDRYSEGAP